MSLLSTGARPAPAPPRPPGTAAGRRADPLTAVCLDAWLLASHGPPGAGLPEGREWEAAVGTLLSQPGMTRRQGPGGTTLLGRRSASGCGHELDAAAEGWAGTLIVECKARADGLAKADVATFEAKCFDLYAGNLAAAADQRWWRLLVSAAPVATGLRRLCASGGTILVDPAVVPVPVLAWVAARPSADLHLPEALLCEMLRLGERPRPPSSAAGCPTAPTSATTPPGGPPTTSTTCSTCRPSSPAPCWTSTTGPATTALSAGPPPCGPGSWLPGSSRGAGRRPVTTSGACGRLPASSWASP
ncbi:MAG: hypothetical protein KY447_08020 [Actinobacteria bacterium]|nr:hypothetical protein [Actinomycetota bacterium]